MGTNNQERLNDPLYLGMRHERVRGEAYQEFIDAFVAAVKKVFPRVVLQWEDFLKENALHQLARFRDQLCTFNDDIQGTAAVVLAGLYGALRITGQRMRDQRVVFAGAGASAQGISELLVAAFMEDGLSREEAIRRIWTTDSRGLVTRDRPNLEEFKATYARPAEEVAGYACKDRSRITLLETIENAKPTMLIGTSATPGTFDEAVVRAMSRLNARPIVFPLSNPTSKTECTPGGRAALVGGAGDRGDRQPVRAGDRGRQAAIASGSATTPSSSPAWGWGSRSAARATCRTACSSRPPRPWPRMVKPEDLAECAVYPELVPDPGVLLRRGLRDDPAGRGGRPRGPGDPRAPREDGRAGHVVPGVPADPLRGVAPAPSATVSPSRKAAEEMACLSASRVP